MAVTRIPKPWPIVAFMVLVVAAVHMLDRALLRQERTPRLERIQLKGQDAGLWQYDVEEAAGVLNEQRPEHVLPDSLMAAGQLRAALDVWNALRQADSTDLRAWRMWGQAMLDAGNHEAAAQALGHVVQRTPEDVVSLQALGVAHSRSGRVELAARAFDRAIAADSSNAKAWMNAGICRLRMEEWQDALARLDAAAERASGMRVAKVQAYRGQALRALGKEEDATEAYREAISRDPDQLLARLGLVQLEADEAVRIRSLEQLRNLASDRGVVHWTLAHAYLAAGRVQEAESAFDRALELVPEEAAFARDLMRLYLDRDQVDRAQALLKERFAAAASSPERLFLEAKMFAGKGDDVGAVERYEAAIEASDGGMAESWLNRGAALRRLGQVAEAIDSYRQALSVRPGYPEAWFNIGVALGESEDHVGAAAAYEECLKWDPDRARAWYNLGLQRDRMGDPAGALAALESAVACDPDYEAAWYNLTRFMRIADDPRTGAALDSLVTRFPENKRGWYNRSVFLADGGDDEGALEGYRRAIEIDPSYADAWNNMAGRLHDVGDGEGALAAYREAVQIESDNARFRFNLALQLERLGKWDEAVVHYRRSNQLDPTYTRPLERIVALGGSGVDGGWAIWAEDQMLSPDSLVRIGADSVYGWARELHRGGHFASARQRYADALALGKSGVWPEYWSAKAAEEQGMVAEAQAGYRTILAVRPDFKFALYRLAIVLTSNDRVAASAAWAELERYHPEFAAEKIEEKP